MGLEKFSFKIRDRFRNSSDYYSKTDIGITDIFDVYQGDYVNFDLEFLFDNQIFVKKLFFEHFDIELIPSKSVDFNLPFNNIEKANYQDIVFKDFQPRNRNHKDYVFIDTNFFDKKDDNQNILDSYQNLYVCLIQYKITCIKDFIFEGITHISVGQEIKSNILKYIFFTKCYKVGYKSNVPEKLDDYNWKISHKFVENLLKLENQNLSIEERSFDNQTKYGLYMNFPDIVNKTDNIKNKEGHILIYDTSNNDDLPSETNIKYFFILTFGNQNFSMDSVKIGKFENNYYSEVNYKDNTKYNLNDNISKIICDGNSFDIYYRGIDFKKSLETQDNLKFGFVHLYNIQKTKYSLIYMIRPLVKKQWGNVNIETNYPNNETRIFVNRYNTSFLCFKETLENKDLWDKTAQYPDLIKQPIWRDEDKEENLDKTKHPQIPYLKKWIFSVMYRKNYNIPQKFLNLTMSDFGVYVYHYDTNYQNFDKYYNTIFGKENEPIHQSYIRTFNENSNGYFMEWQDFRLLALSHKLILPIFIKRNDKSSKTTNVWKKINPKIEKMIYSDNNVLKSKIEITIDNTKDNIIILK